MEGVEKQQKTEKIKRRKFSTHVVSRQSGLVDKDFSQKVKKYGYDGNFDKLHWTCQYAVKARWEKKRSDEQRIEKKDQPFLEGGR